MELSEERIRLPPKPHRGVSVTEQFSDVLLELLSIRYALQNTLISIDLNVSGAYARQGIIQFSREEVEEALKWVGDSWRGLRNSESNFRLLVALVVWAKMLEHAFEQWGSINYINESIKYWHRAMILSSGGHFGKPRWYANLGNLYLARLSRVGDISDGNMAIAYQSRAIRRIPDHDEEKPKMLSALGASYAERFIRLRELGDINLAIKFQTQAVWTISDGDVAKGNILNHLGNSYRARFNRLGWLSDINQAIMLQNQALERTPGDHTDRARGLVDLGSSYWARYNRFGKLEDVSQSIMLQDQASKHMTQDPLEKAKILSHLGSACWIRFKHLGDLSDINQGIKVLTEATQLTPEDHPSKGNNFFKLGKSYRARFSLLGEVSDIDRAIIFQTQSINLAQQGYLSKARCLKYLGISHLARFGRFGAREDVDQAIIYHTQSMELIPDRHPAKANSLAVLGTSFAIRCGHPEETSQLCQAIEARSRAIKLVPGGHLGQTLASDDDTFRGMLVPQHYHPTDLADTHQSITFLTRALQLVCGDDPARTGYLNNLGCAYGTRFVLLGELSDIDKAIAFQTQAIQAVTSGFSGTLQLRNDLGVSYIRRFLHQGMYGDLKNAHDLLQQVALTSLKIPKIQIRSAHLWSACSLSLGIPPYDAYCRGMELVPRMVWLGTLIHERYKLMVDVGDLTLSAAAWAISIGDYGRAAEWLEEGRSIVWNQIIQLRTPFEDLSRASPSLSRNLQRVAHELGNAGLQSASLSSFTDDVPEMENRTQYRHQLASEWEQLVAQARSIQGFEDFMRPPKIIDLQRAAKHSPVVLVNVHSRRCDALIIWPHSNRIGHLPLDYFSAVDAMNSRERLNSEIGSQCDRARGFKRHCTAPQIESNFRCMLATLWRGVVGPVLEFLGYTQPLPVDDLPHVTWCTTGALSFLPLHAAGFYDGVQPNAMDLVVSSYTPTLSALLGPRPVCTTPDSKLLIVGQEYTQGMSHLPNTVQELSAIKTCANGTEITRMEATEATVGAVLDAMEQHDWVHLACHATQNPDNPALSTFHLHDGDLTLEAITKRSFKSKGLAFLSACQTATGDDKRPDESIHLAAGMLMSGYPSVIATMWSICDEDGPEVAGRVYAELLKDGRMDCSEAARALHKAVAGLREKIGRSSFKRWVPFIHIGV